MKTIMQQSKPIQVVITEVRRRIVSVNAFDSEDAVKKIHDDYHEGEFELSAEDVSEVSFQEL